MEINRAVEPPRHCSGRMSHMRSVSPLLCQMALQFHSCKQHSLFFFFCLASPQTTPTSNLFYTKQTSDATQTKYKTPIHSEMPSPCEQLTTDEPAVQPELCVPGALIYAAFCTSVKSAATKQKQACPFYQTVAPWLNKPLKKLSSLRIERVKVP